MTTRETIQPEFSWFRLTLMKYLDAIHSEKINNADFLSERCEEAETTYEQYILQGFPPAIAIEAANEVLLYDAHSEYSLLKEILENDFPDILDRDHDDLIRQLLPICRPIFERDSHNYDDLPQELHQIIRTFLKK